MKWYDKIAGYYDLSTAWIYKKAREVLIEELKINKGDKVLIIACGTGQSFKLIEEKIGKTGDFVALDYSKIMLAVAKKRINRNGWENIRLLNLDVRNLNTGYLNKNDINSNFDIIIGELAFSVIPDWEKVMKTAFLLLKNNGKIGLLDWYRKKYDWLTKTVNYLAKAQIYRNTIKVAKEIFVNFTVLNKFIFNNVYIGIGKKLK